MALFRAISQVTSAHALQRMSFVPYMGLQHIIPLRPSHSVDLHAFR